MSLRDGTDDEPQAFASLTLDCLALSRAMLGSTEPDTEVDELELLRRRRLIQQIEAVIHAGWPAGRDGRHRLRTTGDDGR